MTESKMHSGKPHKLPHSELKTQASLDWDAARALNTVEKYSLDTRSKSINPAEGREVTDAPSAFRHYVSRHLDPK